VASFGQLLPEVSRSLSAPSSWRGRSLKASREKPWRKRASAWMLLAVISLLIIPLSGCATIVSSVGAAASVTGAYFDYLTSEKGEAVIVTPPIVEYDAKVQDRAADEFEKLGPPCARDTIIGDCSAAARLIMDYGILREKIRAAKDN
tara:strand:+ start:3979 stop:4419 length:441 start_codon:yes stop_codon:yes gene_type:complete